jgi:polysaccharide biosynthesis/export protein
MLIKFMRQAILLISLGVLGALGTLSGCVAPKALPYLQDKSYTTTKPVLVTNTAELYRIQAHDVLAIRVQSVQAELNELFNITDTRAILGGDPGTLFLSGYAVDEDGRINLPTVGKLKVAGLTLTQVQALVQQQVSGFVRGANVLVKLLSFKLTILGEVRNPGRYFVYNEQATVLEGLSLAGDLTEFGNRRTIKLIRPTSTGSTVILLDLTDPALLRSPYYFLLPNDVLYVEPLRARAGRGNASNLGLVFAGVSSVVLLLSYLKFR